jgi:hypothetical protein
MQTNIHPAATACTQVVRRLLAAGMPASAAADLIFLEAWERDPAPGIAAVRRVGQIRRAQPLIAGAIRDEIAGWTRPESPLDAER